MKIVGNAYGTSNGAEPHYSEMVSRFSPREVELMMEYSREKDSTLRRRCQLHKRCRLKFIELLQLIDEETVPVKHKTLYQKFLNNPN